MKENLNNNFHLYSSVKPNGKLCDVLSSTELEIKNMDDKDFLIIRPMGGTNDIDIHSNLTKTINDLKRKLQDGLSNNTNVISPPYHINMMTLH